MPNNQRIDVETMLLNDGTAYEEDVLCEWLNENDTSPLTGVIEQFIQNRDNEEKDEKQEYLPNKTKRKTINNELSKLTLFLNELGLSKYVDIFIKMSMNIPRMHVLFDI